MYPSSNSSTTSFDVESWIKNTLPDASSLESVTLKAVEGFVILWNIFERSICSKKKNERNMVEAFQRITQNLPNTAKLEESVNKSLSFYQDRYVQGREMKPTFYNLHFQRSDRQDYVEAVLKGSVIEFSGKVLTLLIIAYRIRNNLFHGLKAVVEWNEQAENIAEASRVLSFMIEDCITRNTAKYL